MSNPEALWKGLGLKSKGVTVKTSLNPATRNQDFVVTRGASEFKFSIGLFDCEHTDDAGMKALLVRKFEAAVAKLDSMEAGA